MAKPRTTQHRSRTSGPRSAGRSTFKIVSPRLLNPTPDGRHGHQGEIHGISYEQLRRKLGRPNWRSGDGKTTTGWVLRFPDGTLASVYEFKATSKFDPRLPSVAVMRKTNRTWNVGGDDSRALRHVARLFGLRVRKEPHREESLDPKSLDDSGDWDFLDQRTDKISACRR